MVRKLSLCFAAGAAGGLASALVLWAGGRLGAHAALGVSLAPPLAGSWLHPRVVWGGLFGALLLLPIAGGALRRGLLIGLAPALFQLFVVLPLWQGRGWLGVELGALTPVVVIAASLVWGVAAVAWLKASRG